jgi:predicted negative regulator of RcsB-dependent stress response
MTEEYLTDDEQLERAKQLAREYGPWTVGAIVIGLTLAYGWRYYQGHQDQIAMNAAAQFDAMSAAVQVNDGAKAREIAQALIKGYPATPYADQAQLTLARLSVDAGQDAAAVGPLTEVMERSKDSELRRIARLRLARVQIDEGKPDDALKTLADATGAFDGTYHEVRGDAYYAKQDLAKAAEEYRAALVESGASGGGMNSALLALKIADLGVPAKSPAAGQATPPAAGPTAAPAASAVAPPAPPATGATAPASAASPTTPASPAAPPAAPKTASDSSNKAKP